jgi:hypothetical protein
MLVGKDQHAQASGRGRGREENQARALHEHQGEKGGRRNRQGHAGTSSQGGTRVGTLRIGTLFRFLWWICFYSLLYSYVMSHLLNHERA